MFDAPTEPVPLTIAQALRNLPLEQPDRSAFPALAGRIKPARKSANSWPWAMLAAAVLAAAVVLPWRAVPTTATPAGTLASASVATDLSALMTESAQLEHLLTVMTDSGMASASTLVLGLQLEDQLGDIDSRLSSSPLDDTQRAALWQQRVSLLSDYTAMVSTQRWMASEGQPLDANLVAVF